MTLILFVIVVIMGFFLADVRKRLARIEREMRQEKSPDRASFRPDEEVVRQPARIVSRASAVPIPATQEDVVPSAEAADLDAVVESLVSEPVQAFTTPRPVVQGPTAEEIASESEQETHEPLTAVPSTELEPSLQKDGSSGFEDLFGRKLPIWAGGVTLLVAAVLLVKYSIDAGLLSPAVRVTMAALFGTLLVGAAELARRMERFVQDDRIAQSLAGAGVGALYAANLSAYNLYHLIGPGTAFGGFCAITALAMGLSIRFGAPCAVLALLGGLATPALVSTGSPNIPLLSGYLAMVIGSLTVLSRRQRWFWLGVMALTGGMGWTAIVILMGALSQMSVLTIGLLVIFLGIALPVLNGSEARGTILRAAGAVAAALQLAVLVSVGGYDAMSWGLYGLLSLAFLWLSGRETTLRPMMVVPMLVSLILCWLWPDPAAPLFTAVTVGIMLIFGGSALWRLWRKGGSISEAGQIAAVAVSSYFAALWHFEGLASDTHFALIGLGFALVPAIGAGLGWAREERQGDWRFPLLVLTGAFLTMVASGIGLEESGWLFPIVPAVVSAVLLLIAGLSRDRRISHGGLAFLVLGFAILMAVGAYEGQLDRLVEPSTVREPVRALFHWAVAALVSGAYGWRYLRRPTGMVMTVITAVLAYGTVAQIVPAEWLAIVTASALLALAILACRRQLVGEFAPALVTLGLIVLGWMVQPLAGWLAPGALSLAGMPMLATDLPSTGMVLRRLLVPALLGGGALWLLRDRLDRTMRVAAAATVAIPAVVALHCLYKLVFALDGADRFIVLGLAERTLWQALLIGAGVALYRLAKQREAALALVGVGLAHNLVYSLLLHDPLWSEQAVGPWPLVNLLLPAFGLAFAAPRLIAWLHPALEEHVRRHAPLVQMPVMLLFAFASLRQLFNGSIFALAPVEQVESIFWSVLAIALAIGWLLWGIRQSARSWRIGSLALMLVAIAKVFLIDASGLEGLLRVASFLALGFSLIGIGWLYSRFLRADPV